MEQVKESKIRIKIRAPYKIPRKCLINFIKEHDSYQNVYNSSVGVTSHLPKIHSKVLENRLNC